MDTPPPLPTREVRTGRTASPGLAAGPLVTGMEARVETAVAGTPEEERTRLSAAIEAAVGELLDLVAAQEDPESAAILEFQAAMAEDDVLVEGAAAAIAAGIPALLAWRKTMNAMAEEYRSAPDEYFRARASDLDDLAERVAGHLGGAAAAPPQVPQGAILLARDLTPSRFLAADWSGGRAIALLEGSPTAHVAILARARGVPMVVGLGGALPVAGHARALLDAEAGRLVLSPDADDEAAHAAARAGAAAAEAEDDRHAGRPAVTADGTPVTVMINVGDPADLDRIDPATTDGIGLVRTEFLVVGGRLPDEAAQLSAYRRLLAWADGRPVVVRTLDAGGDKPIPGYTREEANPFLGLRGIRLSLARPEVFRVQLRALLRAAPEGDLRIMVPMVALPAEMAAVRRMVAEEAAALAAAGLPHRVPPIGMMVEVPAAALTVDLFDTDFLSIGSNDLTQYVMAASRDATGLDGLDDAGAMAVQRVIAATVAAAAARGLPVSLCGDAGSDLDVLPKLLAVGLRSVSVAPAAVGRVKRRIAGLALDGERAP